MFIAAESRNLSVRHESVLDGDGASPKDKLSIQDGRYVDLEPEGLTSEERTPGF